MRLPKEAYYVCRVLYSDDPQVHIIGHWTYPAGTKKTIYVASNAFWEPLTIELPEANGHHWYRVVDTSLPEDEDIVPEEQAAFLPEPTYIIRPRTTIQAMMPTREMRNASLPHSSSAMPALKASGFRQRSTRKTHQ